MITDTHAETRTVRLRSGTLELTVERADRPLDELCGFASRRSKKRGFVFVSKVLGKHYPVRPSVMADVHARLATKVGVMIGPTVVVAMAETATALGQGVYEALWRQRAEATSSAPPLLFLHSTRYRLHQPIALTFDESHSHATDHTLYRPADPAHGALFDRARTLVLVDDEISTGRTLEKLALAYRRHNPRLENVHFVCITDWLGAERQAELRASLGLPTDFHSLLAGRFGFEPDRAFDPGPVPDVTGNSGAKDDFLCRNYGRLGYGGLAELPERWRVTVSPGQKVLVLGTGEFAYPPFLLARELERQGHDVWYQSTTRSPLLPERDLSSVLEFPDNYHDGIVNFVYNVAGRNYDRVLIGYETHPLPAEHRLAELLAGEALFF